MASCFQQQIQRRSFGPIFGLVGLLLELALGVGIQPQMGLANSDRSSSSGTSSSVPASSTSQVIPFQSIDPTALARLPISLRTAQFALDDIRAVQPDESEEIILKALVGERPPEDILRNRVRIGTTLVSVNSLRALILNRVVQSFVSDPIFWTAARWRWHLRVISSLSIHDRTGLKKDLLVQLPRLEFSDPTRRALASQFWHTLVRPHFGHEATLFQNHPTEDLLQLITAEDRAKVSVWTLFASPSSQFTDSVVRSLSEVEEFLQMLDTELARYVRANDDADFQTEIAKQIANSLDIVQSTLEHGRLPIPQFKVTTHVQFVTEAAALARLSEKLGSNHDFDQTLARAIGDRLVNLVEAYFVAVSQADPAGYLKPAWNRILAEDHRNFMLSVARGLRGLKLKAVRSQDQDLILKMNSLAQVLFESRFWNFVWHALKADFEIFRTLSPNRQEWSSDPLGLMLVSESKVSTDQKQPQSTCESAFRNTHLSLIRSK